MRQLRRNAVRGLAGLATATALAVAAGGGAWAHECFNASRSATGNEAAGTHSSAWFTLTLDELLQEFGLPADVISCVEAGAPAAGIPDSFVLGNKQAKGQDNVIAENNPNMDAKGLAADGKGIDHAEDVYGDALNALIGSCMPA